MKKILIIDDEPDVRTLLNRRLSVYQYQILEAADGSVGLSVAKKEHPNLIVLDIMMPGEDGIKIYVALREDPETKAIPVIFLTALSGGTNLTSESLKLMARTKYGLLLDEDYVILGKPYDSKELLKQVRMALGEEPSAPR